MAVVIRTTATFWGRFPRGQCRCNRCRVSSRLLPFCLLRMTGSTSMVSSSVQYTPHVPPRPPGVLRRLAPRGLLVGCRPNRVLQYPQSPSYGLRVPCTVPCGRRGVFAWPRRGCPGGGAWKRPPWPWSIRPYCPLLPRVDLCGWRCMAQARRCLYRGLARVRKPCVLETGR